MFVCQARIVRGDTAAVIDTAKELLTLSEDHGLPQTRAVALIYQGWAMGQTKDAAEGTRCVEDGLTAWNRIGTRTNLCLSFCLLAETYLAGGRHEEALKQADLALATSLELGDQWCLPRVHMIRARLLQQSRYNLEAAEAGLRTAINVAALQCAKGPELHAATALARLWRDQGKPQQARELLAPVYGWFTEGFDTLDLQEAKALLEELAS